MKKKLLVFLGILSIFLTTACGADDATPSKAVENFLGKYQSMDEEVLTQLDNIVDKDSTLSDDDKKEYKSLMERQYQNLSYKIEDEEIDGDNAEVKVEVEVFDYSNALKKAKEYFDEHKDEFTSDDGVIDDAKYMARKLKEMTNAVDKKEEDLTFTLKKEDGKWKVQNLSEIDIEKIHGLYED